MKYRTTEVHAKFHKMSLNADDMFYWIRCVFIVKPAANYSSHLFKFHLFSYKIQQTLILTLTLVFPPIFLFFSLINLFLYFLPSVKVIKSR